MAVGAVGRIGGKRKHPVYEALQTGG